MNDQFYLCFTIGFPEDMARALFVKKFGKQPARVFVEKGLLKVGPEPRQVIDTAREMREADARETW